LKEVQLNTSHRKFTKVVNYFGSLKRPNLH
jgi:hypothetical protein